jgi:hypothetical protein
MPGDPVDDLHPTPGGRRRVGPPSSDSHEQQAAAPSTRRMFARDVAREETDRAFHNCKEFSDEALRQKRYKAEPELNFLRPGARWVPASAAPAPPATSDGTSRPSTTVSSAQRRRFVTETSPRLLQPLRADAPPPPPLVVPAKIANLDLKFQRLYGEAHFREIRMETKRAQAANKDEHAHHLVEKKFDGTSNDFVEQFLLAPSARRAKKLEELQNKFAPAVSPGRQLSASELKASTSRLYDAGVQHTKAAMERLVRQYCGAVSPPKRTIGKERLAQSVARLYGNKN